MASSLNEADVLLVTVNAIETKALLKAFESATGGQAQARSIEDRVYRDLGVVNGMRIVHALSEMGSGGAGSAQQTVDRAIRALNPKAVIAVGVAFGTNGKKQSIGDILLSRQLLLYEPKRLGGVVIPRGDRPHASSSLLNFLVGVSYTTWTGAPVHVGTILSGEKLIDDIRFRDELVAMEPEAIGGEMEGAGLYVASSDHKVDWIVVKAICDWADGNKNEDKRNRQDLAACNAARFLVHAFQQVPFVARKSEAPETSESAGGSSSVSRSRHHHLQAELEELTEAFQSHRAQYQGHLTAILNKMIYTDDSFEESRIALDKRVFALLPRVLGFAPPQLGRTISRLRLILSSYFTTQPEEIYYELLEARCSRRAVVDAAVTLYNDLFECYVSQVYLFTSGETAASAYLQCMAVNHLDVNAKSVRQGGVYQVAWASILLRGICDDQERGYALFTYAGERANAVRAGT